MKGIPNIISVNRQRRRYMKVRNKESAFNREPDVSERYWRANSIDGNLLKQIDFGNIEASTCDDFKALVSLTEILDARGIRSNSEEDVVVVIKARELINIVEAYVNRIHAEFDSYQVHSCIAIYNSKCIVYVPIDIKYHINQPFVMKYC